jgi:hypothetical protein
MLGARLSLKGLVCSIVLLALAVSTIPVVGTYALARGSQITSDVNNDIDAALLYYHQNNTAWIFWSAQNPNVLVPTFDIYYRIMPLDCLSNACLTFPYPIHRLTNGPGNNDFDSAAETADGRVWVFYSSDRYANSTRPFSGIFYRTFNRTAWSTTDTELTPWNATDQSPSAIATNDGGLLVAWSSSHGCTGSCISNIWEDKYNGTAWQTPLQATSTGVDFDPSLSQAADGTIWLTYSEEITSKSGDQDILYKLINSGCSSNPLTCRVVDLTNSTGTSDNEFPSIVNIRNGGMDGATILLWSSDRLDPGTSYSIYSKYSLNSGSTWSSDMNITYGNGYPGGDKGPSAAQLGPGRVGIVWSSNTTGTPNIFSSTILMADVGVTAVTPQQTIIGHGTTITVNVTLTDNGWEQEMPTVSLTANGTTINGNVKSGGGCTATVMGVASCRVPYLGSTTASFAWNTTGLRGHYILTASEGNLTGEASTSDNSLSTTVIVTIPGDVNGDGVVNIIDLVDISLAFGSIAGSPRYNPNLDPLLLGVIDIRDLVYVASKFGNTG